MLPHPLKAHYGGEDAVFWSTDGRSFGVADGVGGWNLEVSVLSCMAVPRVAPFLLFWNDAVYSRLLPRCLVAFCWSFWMQDVHPDSPPHGTC